MKTKVRGLRKAQNEILRMAKEDGIDMQMPVSIGYTGDEKAFEAFSALCDEQIGNVKFRNAIGSVIGTHVGPGGAAITYYRKQ